MSEYLYKVKSIETIEGEGAAKFARLHAADNRHDRTHPQELCLSLDNVRPGDFVRLTATKLTQMGAEENVTQDRMIEGSQSPALIGSVMNGSLFFLHHHDRKNQGDLFSGPYHYFSFGEFKKISWDKEILKGGSTDFAEGDSIIMGGGIYFTKDKPRLANIIKKSKHFIGWGLGLDSRLNLDEFVKNYSLLGTRERHSNLIDNKKIFYVPCVSCMNPVFDGISDIESDKAFDDLGYNDVVLHLNGGFNKSDLLSKLRDLRSSSTIDSFPRIIANLKNSGCVVTNSYHGAFWGSLLGKKVVCIKTDIPKWEGLHKNVAFADLSEITDAIQNAKNVPSDYLKECRALNEDFFQKVTSLLRS